MTPQSRRAWLGFTVACIYGGFVTWGIIGDHRFDPWPIIGANVFLLAYFLGHFVGAFGVPPLRGLARTGNLLGILSALGGIAYGFVQLLQRST